VRDIFICLILFFSLNVQAQKATFGLDISYGSMGFVFDSKELIEVKPSAFLEIGGKIYFDISEKYQFFGGLSFEKRNTQFKDFSPIFFCDLELTGNVSSLNSFYEINHDLFYITIPVKNRIKLIGY